MDGSLIQYYDPDLSDERWRLSTEIQNLLPPPGDDTVMLANEAAVMTSAEVERFWLFLSY